MSRGVDNKDMMQALVVDDNAANIMVLSTMLERYGLVVDSAESGMEAIEKSCSKQYDLILMDYLMPNMDGVEAVRQIMFLSEGEDKPVIIAVSATVDREVTELFESVGAVDILMKPVRNEELKTKLIKHGILESQQEKAFSEDSDTESLKFLSVVEGLDYKIGIQLMAGSIENYMKVLEVCVRNVIENYNSIDVIRNTVQMESMALYFHSLKGIFLNVGANELAEQSMRMELAAKEFENLYVHEQMESYLECVKKFHIQLSEACNIYKEQCEKSRTGEQMPDSEFLESIQKLKSSIDNFEYMESVEQLEQLLGATSGERKNCLNEIYEKVQNFQYEEALQIWGKLS